MPISDSVLVISVCILSISVEIVPSSCSLKAIRTIRSQDYSFPGTFVPMMELSFSGPFVPWNFRSRDNSFPRTFVPWTVRSPGTFDP